MEADPATFYLAGLAAMSSLVAGRFKVLTEMGLWCEPINLWALVVVASGGRKTELLKQAAYPVRRLDGVYRRRWADEAARVEDGEQPPPRRRFIVTDTSTAALVELIGRQQAAGYPAAPLVAGDEVLGIIERANHNPGDRALWMRAADGGHEYDVDRITREAASCRHLTVSLVGAIQRGPMGVLVADAGTGLRADGLLQRFQLLNEPNPPTGPVTIPECVDPASSATAAVVDLASRLDDLSLAELEAEADPEGGLAGIRLSPAARALFNAFYIEHQTRLTRTYQWGEGGALVSHLSKTHGTVLRVAAVDHCCCVAAGLSRGPISEGAMGRAIQLAREVLIPGAVRVYGFEPAATGAARRVLEMLRDSPDMIDVSGGVHRVTARSIRERKKPGLKTEAEVRAALDDLEARGYMRVCERSNPQGRPTVWAEVNPRAVEAPEGDAEDR